MMRYSSFIGSFYSNSGSDWMQKMIQYLRRHRLLIYFLAVFSFSWICWLSANLGTGDPILNRDWFIAQLGVFAPFIVAVVATISKKCASRGNGSWVLLAALGAIGCTGYIISRYRVTDLNQLPGTLQVWVVVMGIGLLIMFLLRKRTLYAVRIDSTSRRI